MTHPGRHRCLRSRRWLQTAIAVLVGIGLSAACSTDEPAEAIPSTTEAASEASETTVVSGTIPSTDVTALVADSERQSEDAAESAAPDVTRTESTEPAVAAGDPAEESDDSDLDEEEPQEPDTTLPAPPAVEVSDVKAPQWPFRGMVQAFGADVDGNGIIDLLLQYHDSTTRASSEILIKNYAFIASACRPGIRFNDRELWLGDSLRHVVVPWGDTAVVSDSASPSARTTDTETSIDDDRLTAAGTRFTLETAGNRARIMADGVEGLYRVSGAGADHPSETSSEARLWFRGTDGELLAISYSPDGRPDCDDQFTAVVSLRTGETIACGRHSGDIEFVTPPGAGLGVDDVKVPLGDSLGIDGCDASLAQRPLDGSSEGSLFGEMAALPALSQLFAPRCSFTGSNSPVIHGGTVPDAPFYGAVLTSSEYDTICEEHRIIVRLHDAQSRMTAVFTASNLQQLECANHVVLTANGLQLYGYQLHDDPGRVRTSHHLIELRWGELPSVSLAGTLAGWPSISHFSSTPQLAWHDELALDGSAISVQSHTNGVRLSVGAQVRGYALSRAGTSGEPEQRALMGRFLLGDSYVGLKGTDGEHVAFTWSNVRSDCAPSVIYVLSMRDGGQLACGALETGDLLLVTPENGGLLTQEIVLADSGWLDRADCSHGLDEDLLDALEKLPGASTPYPTSVPEAEPLPAEVAPGLPFQGAVRVFERYDAASFGSDVAVQFYDSATGTFSEVVFAESAFEGWKHDFFVASGGIAIALDPLGGDRLVIPWGGAPRVITAQAAAEADWQPQPGPSTPYPTSLELDGSSMDLDGYEPWPAGVLSLRYQDMESWLITAPPPESVPPALELTLGESSPAWTAHLRGTDGRVLALRYLHEYFDECEPNCGVELTYLISLVTGEVLACGVEPRYSEFAFVKSGGAGLPSEIVLPPSGWLDPGPCLRGPPASSGGCSLFVREGESDTHCVRQFDLRDIDDAIDGASVAATVVRVGRDE